MSLIRELLEYSETGDAALDQQAADIRRKTSDSNQADRKIEQLKRERLKQVSSRIKSLMLRKQQMNDQIDQQIEREREREKQ